MKQIGAISGHVIALLDLHIAPDTPIFLGRTNKIHMREKHPQAFLRYGADIPTILACPDFVGMNPSDGSIEYVKEYIVQQEHVKVAVRVSTKGRYYARSLYVLNPNRVENFVAKGTLKRI